MKPLYQYTIYMPFVDFGAQNHKGNKWKLCMVRLILLKKHLEKKNVQNFILN